MWRDLTRYVLLAMWLLLTSLLSMDAFAFQAFTYQTENEARLPKSYRKYVWYVTDTYFDFQSQSQKPVNPLVIAIWQRSFDVLAEQSGVAGLAYQFGGTYNIGTDKFVSSIKGLEHTIYVDLTGNEWKGEVGEHAGLAEPSFSKVHDGFLAGGTERFNTKMFDIVHPDINVGEIITHEQGHLLGLDHSTFASARMAYTNPTWEGIGDDDRRGLMHLFGEGDDTEVNVTSFMNGELAQGVEVVFINATTGQSFGFITSVNYAKGAMRGIPAGDYYVAGRELTPTGPCFSNPTNGFLTSFYISDEQSSNAISAAAVVSVTTGDVVNLKLNLIQGKKRFDCYYAVARHTSTKNANAQVMAESNGFHLAFGNTVRQGAFAGSSLYTDLVVSESKRTDTDINSGLHPSLVVRTIGAGHPLSISSQGYDTALDDAYREIAKGWGEGKLTLFEGQYSEDAELGSYAAYCEADGETALMSQMIELRETVDEALSNDELFPEYRDLMSDAAAPKSIHVGGVRFSNESTAKPVNMGVYLCGVTGASGAGALSHFMVLLFPLVFGAASNARRRMKK
jgi:hypothetical protein